MTTEAIIAIWVASTIIATMIGAGKGKGVTGFLLGAFLGVIGVIIIASIPATTDASPSPSIGGWWPDPFGRFEKRYYDGATWTNHVISTDGTQSVEQVA